MRWFGEEKRPNQKRRDDGMAEDCQVDWTGLDRTGQDRTRGRETRTSKVEEIETDRQTDTHTYGDQDQTDQIDRSRDEQSTPTQQASYPHWHTATVQANEKKMTTALGTVLCCAVRYAVCVCVLSAGPPRWWCAVLSLQTTGLPLSPVYVIGSLPSICGSVSSMQRRNPFRFGPPFCCLVRKSAGRAGWQQQSRGVAATAWKYWSSSPLIIAQPELSRPVLA